MWKFKPFGHKEQTGLEGRIIDIGNLKVQIRNIIAEGGFSCVYLARDAINGSKQYALKHIICNDEESLQLVMKEISVMKTLKGHPNVVPLLGHALFDMGRTKEAFLLMEYCEKSLVTVLESRGAGFFEEKQVLTLFRDICNAVFAMHCQNPPIAHRDLKAENLLLGSDGLWKLCDFGSTSTNHKVFDKPEEMGIEEDNIRKHTTPAYRSPEMWDLFRRELINEKVDIWALGCLLFRICYLKSAFDGESKLQILNGNYRIPELPKYSTLVTDLIRDMLQSSPGDRPDITQVWFRVNDLLPESLQKSLPDRPPEMLQHSSDAHAGTARPANKSSPVPCRSPPPPPSSEPPRNSSSASNNSRTGETAAPLGAFWTTQHAKDSDITPQKEQTFQSPNVQKNTPTKDLNLFPDNLNHTERSKQPKQNDAYNSFVAEFDVPSNIHHKPDKEKKLEAEVEKLKEQLAHVSAEKAEVTSKYEKLTAICRSQRQEIQDLKNTLNAKTPSPSRDSSRNTASRGSQSATTPQNEKIEGTVWELQQGFFDQGSASSDSQKWQPFTADDSNKPQTVPTNNSATSVRTRSSKNWGFETDSFKVVPTAGSSSKVSKPIGELSSSQRFGASKSAESKVENQPAGWAGF